MKHIFLSANEDLESGLIQSQFVRPVVDEFRYFYQFVSVNRPFFRHYRPGLARQVNLLIPQRLIAYNLLCWLYLPWAALVASVLYLRLIRPEPESVRMVARGYLSGLICLAMNRLFSVSYVFDPRSLYPLESITAGLMRKGALSFYFWVWVERRVVRRAHKAVCVSDGMARYFRRRYQCRTTVLIPCFSVAPCTAKKTDSDRDTWAESGLLPLSREDVRRALGVPANRQLLLYLGSLNDGWNNIGLYTRHIERFPPDLYHVLLISQDASRIRTVPLGQLPNVTVLTIQNLPVPLTLADCLASADFGLVFMGPSNDWFTRLSVKFAEYTAHGLPVLVNQWVGEAAHLIRRHGLEPSRVLAADDPLPSPATPTQRAAIAAWAGLHFDQANINRITEPNP